MVGVPIALNKDIDSFKQKVRELKDNLDSGNA
jgi:hypothetical protein